MNLKDNQLDLALLQLNELAALYGKNSAVVRAAQAFDRKRRSLKKNAKLFFRRLFKTPAPKPEGKLKILVHVRGGIGDVCMTRPLIKRLRESFPAALIYFCYDSRTTVDTVFPDGLTDGFVPRGYDPKEYDLVIAGCHAFNFDYYDLPRLQYLAPQWMPSFQKALALQQKLQIVINNTPHLDGLWAKISMAYGSARVANTGLTTGFPITQNDRAPLKPDPQKLHQTLDKFGLSGKKYITIHDGTNTNTDLHGRQATRCWPRVHWERFGQLFKQQFPDILLVQLGAGNSAAFGFADICLVGKTAVPDLPYILQGALLHIDGESGMVQLANLTDTRAIVLFGPTPVAYFGYARNINLRAGDCRECMCIRADWMSRCPLFDTNRCLHAIKPEKVLEETEKLLAAPQADFSSDKK